MTLLSTYSFQQVVEAGLSVWDLYLSRWGDLNGGSISVRYPTATISAIPDPFIDNVLGMRIGPYSAIDSVMVAHGSIANGAAPTERDEDNLDLLSIHEPILYPLKGPIHFFAGFNGQVGGPGPLPNLANAPVFTRCYGALGPISGAEVVFGFGTQGNIFRDTLLHVQLFLNRPAIEQAIERNSWKRAPYCDSIETSGIGTTETILAIWPVWGRRAARVTYSAFNEGSAVAFNVRTTMAVQTEEGTAGEFVEVPASGAVETVTTNADGNAGTTHNFTDLNAAFLIARCAKVTAGTIEVGTSIHAQD